MSGSYAFKYSKSMNSLAIIFRHGLNFNIDGINGSKQRIFCHVLARKHDNICIKLMGDNYEY